ncbi:MAG: glycosyl hydrolase family 65 protein, partial [Chitinispirillia bacterium]
KIFKNGNEKECACTYETSDRFVAQDFFVHVKKDETVTLDKIVSVYTSRDINISDPLFSAKECLKTSDNFNILHKIHCKEWNSLWEKMDIEIDGGRNVQKVIRFHAYHLLVTASLHNLKNDASIPARGLHGEAYRGHIFWDELFVFPFYNLHFPEITRSLLLYRYKRLDKAREYAKEHGYKGAMYPWQSGSDGREETQIIHLNPNSGEWGDDYSSLQRHVSLAIAYNIWMYYWTTDDKSFLAEYGAEMIFEIARFWASKCSFNKQTDRYEIHNVMGPDEYHEKYPDAKEGGLKDNTYTNVLCVWTMKKCLKCIDILRENEFDKVKSKINLLDDEISLWENIICKMNISVRNDIISQYDGFLDLKELDWEGYRKKYKNIARLDRILKAEGLSPDDYQLSKQADLLMLFYILPSDEVGEILRSLGCKFNDQILRKNYNYYLERTSHGSTLSLVVHSRVAALFDDMKLSMEWFQKALTADISDIQGGTVKEGIHTGLMAGTIHIFLASFIGLSFFKERISFNPKIPHEWKKIAFNFTFKNIRYYLNFEKGKLRIQIDSPAERDVSIRVSGKDYSLPIGKMTEITL